MTLYVCKQCAKEFKRNGVKPGVFCSRECKGNWQREQKGYSKAWLEQKYLKEGLSTYQIAKIVERNPKQVYEWLIGYGIPTRERAWDTDKHQPYHDKEYLLTEYVEKQRSSGEISEEFGVSEANIIFFLKRHGIKRRTTSEARAVKRWGLNGSKNPMFGRRGSASPKWKGGTTPERQAFYSSMEWKAVEAFVIERDDNTCQRCGKQGVRSHLLHIHHVIPVETKRYRADPMNLVMLCSKCHGWVHSKANTERQFLA